MFPTIVHTDTKQGHAVHCAPLLGGLSMTGSKRGCLVLKRCKGRHINEWTFSYWRRIRTRGSIRENIGGSGGTAIPQIQVLQYMQRTYQNFTLKYSTDTEIRVMIVWETQSLPARALDSILRVLSHPEIIGSAAALPVAIKQSSALRAGLLQLFPPQSRVRLACYDLISPEIFGCRCETMGIIGGYICGPRDRSSHTSDHIQPALASSLYPSTYASALHVITAMLVADYGSVIYINGMWRWAHFKFQHAL